MAITTNERGYPTQSLTGMTFTFSGVVMPGHVTVPDFTAKVVGSNWYFDHVNSVEVVVPGHGRRVVPVERITDLNG
jgi:hypothetical protein